MNKIILTLIVLLLTFSCKKNTLPDPIIGGLASPYIIQADTSIFYISDYVLDFRNLDSVIFPVALKLEQVNDSVYQLCKQAQLKPLEIISVYKNGTKENILVINREKQKITITYKGSKQLKNIKVIGSMNNWNRNNPGMTYSDRLWKQEFTLAPGVYEYLFYVDGKEFADPENPEHMGNNSVYRLGKYLPEELPYLTTKTFNTKNIEITSNQELTEVFAFCNNTRIDAAIKENIIEIKLPDFAKSSDRSHLKVYAYNSNGISNDILIPLNRGKVIENTKELNRSDFRTMIMYFLMVDRFFNGDTTNDEPVADKEILPKANYFGGDLAGVKAKLDKDYFSNLGINTLWLSPISQNPKGAFGLWPEPRSRFSGYHGYWPISITQIDYRFGKGNDLKNLVSKAHNDDINVLLDYVAHHVHQEHPVYIQHPDWFTSLYLPDGSLNTEKWDEYRLTTWFDTFLPTLDLSRKDVVDAMVDSAVFWLKEYGVDGFRHDATKHIDEIYWRTLTQKIKQVSKEKPFYQIGETYGSPLLIGSYISSGMLDAQFDFNVYDNAVACFAIDKENFTRLKSVLSESWKYYGYNNLMGNISGNQDRARFISYAGGSLKFDENAKLAGWTRNIEVGDSIAYNKLEMLHAFNMTIPGIPVIYYGDEIGMPGGNDPDNRRQMKFDNLTGKESELLGIVKKLINIRKSNIELLYGQSRILRADSAIFAYTRNYFDKNSVVIFNKSKLEQYVELSLPVSKETLKSEFGAELKAENNKLAITIKPYSFDIIHY